jgi:hypothetical protein
MKHTWWEKVKTSGLDQFGTYAFFVPKSVRENVFKCTNAFLSNHPSSLPFYLFIFMLIFRFLLVFFSSLCMFSWFVVCFQFIFLFLFLFSCSSSLFWSSHSVFCRFFSYFSCSCPFPFFLSCPDYTLVPFPVIFRILFLSFSRSFFSSCPCSIYCAYPVVLTFTFFFSFLQLFIRFPSTASKMPKSLNVIVK